MTLVNDDGAAPSREEQAAEWCFRLVDRPLTDAEGRDYRAWIAADARNRETLEAMVAVWNDADAISDMPGFLSLRAKALTAMERSDDRGRERPLVRRFALAAFAATLVLLMSGLWHLVARPDTYATGIGERRIVQLDDGSRVSLDASSAVSVAMNGDRRRILLTRGRAKFDVAKDALRPFTVTAGGRTVVATGTAFSVELLRDEMRVLLYEGSVEVVPIDEGLPAIPDASRMAMSQGNTLRPGQELVASFSSRVERLRDAQLERAIAWEAGRLDFVDEPLGSAVERVNRYATVPIVIGDAAAARYRVNGIFDAGDVSSFVTGLTMLFPIAAEPRDGRIMLTSSTKNRGANPGAVRPVL